MNRLLSLEREVEEVLDGLLRQHPAQGGPRGGNLEHQPSGMTWALDNWIYTAVNNYRLRWKDGQLIKQDIPGNGGQWGATQDDEGKFWVVNAGGE